MCGWITHFLHTLLIHWCCTQHASTSTPAPSHHLLLKSLQIYTEKNLWDKAGTGEEMQLPQQSCGSVTSSWTPSSELKQLKLRPHTAEQQQFGLDWDLPQWLQEAEGTPLRAEHVHCCTHMVLGPLHHATEHPVGQRSTRYCSFLSAHFWANAQAIKAGCRSNDRLKFLCVTAMLRSPLYH